MPSLASWCKIFLSGAGVMGSWAEHSASYWAQRHLPNVLLLSFKSMQADLKGTVLKIAKFLDVNVPEETIAEVCRKSSFGYMKTIDRRFAPEGVHPWGRKVEMMRKGVHGGSSELLSQEQQREIDAHFMAELKRLGSDLPYEEFCDLA
jgi:aryl sulfotransferase